MVPNQEVNLLKNENNVDCREAVSPFCFIYARAPTETVDAEAWPSGVPISSRDAEPKGKEYERPTAPSLFV